MYKGRNTSAENKEREPNPAGILRNDANNSAPEGNLIIKNANIFTPEGATALKGEAMGRLRNIPEGEIEITEGVITYTGPEREPVARDKDSSLSTCSRDRNGSQQKSSCHYKVIDAGGKAVLPGFVDSHTHMVFGGYRPDEFMWRVRGESYMSIMNRGGGIASTVNATRNASKEELTLKTMIFIERMSRMGVTTVEGKSGYGLDRDTELKQLEVMRDINGMAGRKADIVTTYLGAHACPAEYKGREDKYIDLLISQRLPEIKALGLAENCDIFCEKGVFTPEQSERLLKAARDMGFGAKIHADEIVCTKGAQLGAGIGAISADHLLQCDDEGIEALAGSTTVATLLPLTAFALREPYAPGRRMIDKGCAVALATDLNPGSCFSGSIPLTFALAVLYMNLTVEEAITALTLNGAAACARARDRGSLEEGKLGDLVILDSDTINYLPYYTGMNAVRYTVKRGRIVAENG